MKKSFVVFSILLAGLTTQARSLECTDLSNNETIVSLTDDMGSIVRGGYAVFGASNNFSSQLEAYTYYYGEYVFIKDVNYDEEVIEVAAVRLPGSAEFTGFFNYSQSGEVESIYAAKVKCIEL